MHPPVTPFPEESIERAAYDAVADIPVAEMNDRNRLGYHVYLFLTRTIETLDEAVHVAQARSSMDRTAIVRTVRTALEARGVYPAS